MEDYFWCIEFDVLYINDAMGHAWTGMISESLVAGLDVVAN